MNTFLGKKSTKNTFPQQQQKKPTTIKKSTYNTLFFKKASWEDCAGSISSFPVQNYVVSFNAPKLFKIAVLQRDHLYRDSHELHDLSILCTIVPIKLFTDLLKLRRNPNKSNQLS